jgi:hypothetical protein
VEPNRISPWRDRGHRGFKHYRSVKRGGDVERRFSLIRLDNSFELILRAYLQKRGVKTVRWRKEDKVVDLAVAHLRINDLLSYSERADLKIKSD